MSSDEVLLATSELVAANRILYAQGVVDGFGHVSIRHPGRHDRFLIARSMAPALVTHDDILCLDLDGQEHDDRGRKSYLERFIHSAIYAARPDVHAIVHSHSPNIIPFSVTRTPLRPIYHMCGFLGHGCAMFDIRNSAGDTDMLIRDDFLGKELADALGLNAIVLMRGHGSTVVAASLKKAVFRAIYAETNARLQSRSEALGTVTYLSEKEALLAADSTDSQVGRAWDLWIQEAGTNGPQAFATTR